MGAPSSSVAPASGIRCNVGFHNMWFLVWIGVLVLYLEIIIPVNSVDISLSDICGNKLVGSCPKKISLKVIGGQSSCAEKVPWNVLVELKSGPQRLNDGEHVSNKKVIASN